MKIRKENYLRKMIVLLLAAAVLVVGMLPDTVLALASNIASGTDWTLDGDGKLTITSNAGMADWINYWNPDGDQDNHPSTEVKSVEIKDGVTEIGRCAFHSCGSLKSVSIPASVAKIDNWAFHSCGSLESVTIPVAVSRIGECAFYKCSSLESVTIPEGVERIEGLAFGSCTNLESIIIPASVTYIGNVAFQATGLKSITIPENVTEIGQAAFQGCTNLAEVKMLGETPPTIGDNVFQNCKFVTDNKKGIQVPSDEESTYKEAWTAWADYIGAYIASGTDWTLDADGRMTITSDAGMTDWIAKKDDYENSVKSVNISDGVTNIGDAAFSYCRNLTSVSIPDSVTSIGEDAFGVCNSLTDIEIPDSVRDIGEAAFRGCKFSTIEIPSAVTSIEKGVFLGCASLTSVSIPDSVTSIGSSAFERCTSLEEITIPEQVAEIGQYAFSRCTNLTEVTIPAGVTNIGEATFFRCSALTSITIPAGVTTIGLNAFNDCTSLTEVVMLGGTPPAIGETGVEDDTFTGCKFVTDNKKGIRVPAGKSDAYKGAWTNWADYIMDDVQMAAEAKTAAADKLKTITVTNATTKEEILSAVNAALSSVGISGVTVTVEGFTKTEATALATGSIRGTVKLTCGNQTETVTINQTIAKLPNTGNEAAKKVAEAKTAAEGALQTIKLTNAATKEEIQSAVNAALNSAGISGVTVTVENFTKTEATTSAAGSIRATVKITCGNQTETVTINQTIAKLSETGGAGSMTEEEKASVGKLVKELGVSEETAAKILAAAKELDVPMETLLIGEDTLKNHKSEGDIKGSAFQKLQTAASKTTSKSVKLIWNKVKGADGYQIYGAKCGKANKLKLLKDTKKGSTKTYTQKKLKKGTAYKYIVRAYKVIDGKKITIAASKCVHVYTDGGKYGNTKSIKVKKSKVTLKKGKTYKLKASEVKAKKKLKRHRKLGYESSNKKVATVTSKGVIRAKAKGTCTVYVYAQNGKQKKIKVTVK